MSTFGHQDQLPQLPVPALRETVDAYLQSVEALLTAEEFAETKRKAAELVKEGGIGEKLQALLEQRAAGVRPRDGPKQITDADHPDGSAYPDAHWLERWWETLAYQSDRMSLAVNINCFQSHFRAKPCADPLSRFAWSLRGCLDGKRLYKEGLIPAERAGKAMLCSAQYHRIFSTTRVPGAEVDALRTSLGSTHFCVERRGHWYVVADAEDMSVAQLRAELEAIVADAAVRARGPGVAAFTGIDRSRWAAARSQLQAVSKVNVATLEALESAVFHVVLSEATPDCPDEVQRLGQHANGEQIWFDKSQTHVLFDNGCMITNLEHSSADAVVPARLYVYMDAFVHKNAPQFGFAAGDFADEKVAGIPVTADSGGSATSAAAKLRRADFVLDDALWERLNEAKAELAGIIDDNIVTCLDFADFGARTLSQTCKGISTDSFAQMSLALAYFRDQGEMPVTYETASTRSFFHGRTETIRPQSVEMRDFVRAFDDAAVPRAQIADLIRAAGGRHRDYLRRCMAGKGVDRHLLGLRVLAAEQGLPMPELFTDKAYPLSTTFTLSTSQMPFGSTGDWPGFGAYDPSAYAVCYRFTGFDTIVATVASRKKSGKGKDARRFSEVIKQAFRDVQAVLAAHPPPPKSKL